MAGSTRTKDDVIQTVFGIDRKAFEYIPEEVRDQMRAALDAAQSDLKLAAWLRAGSPTGETTASIVGVLEPFSSHVEDARFADEDQSYPSLTPKGTTDTSMNDDLEQTLRGIEEQGSVGGAAVPASSDPTVDEAFGQVESAGAAGSTVDAAGWLQNYLHPGSVVPQAAAGPAAGVTAGVQAGLPETEGMSEGDLKELRRMLVLTGYYPVARFRQLREQGRLDDEFDHVLVRALESALTDHETSGTDVDLLTFLQQEAAGLEWPSRASQMPSQVGLRQAARGTLQDLTGVAPRDQVAEVADSFSMKQAEQGLSAEGQFQEHVEQTQGGAVLATRVDNAVNVLREMVGL